MENTEKVATKLKSLTLQQKAELIHLIERGKSIRDLAGELGISKNTLHFIYKNREKYCSEVENKPVSKIN